MMLRVLCASASEEELMTTKTSQCPNCKTENRSEAQYCVSCGKTLSAGAVEPEHSSVGSGPTAPSEAASEPARSIGSVGTDQADELVFDSPPAPDKPPKPPSPAPKAATPPSEPDNRKPTTQNQRGLSRAPVRPKPPKTDVSPKKPATPATPQVDLPKTERKPADKKPEQRSVKRTTYTSLRDKLPGCPFLALLGTGEPPQAYPIRHCLITFGRGPENQITIQDSKMSRAHALLALVGRDFLLIDLGSKCGTSVNGRQITQAKLAVGDVVEIGSTRLVLAVVPGADRAWGYELCSLWAQAAGSEGSSGDDGLLMGDAVATDDTGMDEDVEGRIVLKGTTEAGQVTSDGSPILIGNHETCRMRLEGDGVTMFHAQLYWGAAGIHLRDLKSSSGTFVNGEPIDDVVVQAGDEIAIGGAKLSIECFGEIEAICQKLASEDDIQRPLALTCVSGRTQGVSGALPPSDRSLTLGRGPDCELQVVDPRMSARHASLTVRQDNIDIEDLGSKHGIQVNGREVESGTVKVGDVIQVGKSEFVVHRAV